MKLMARALVVMPRSITHRALKIDEFFYVCSAVFMISGNSKIITGLAKGDLKTKAEAYYQKVSHLRRRWCSKLKKLQPKYCDHQQRRKRDKKNLVLSIDN